MYLHFFLSLRRTRNLSGGSPKPRHAKKIHFIKNMKQYDTRGSRIVLICAKRSLCAAFSVLPYGESFYLSDPTLNHPRRRHSSGNISTTLEMLPGLEGFQLDIYGRSVSYAQFLYPTNALTTVIEYVKPSDLKKDMNETFKEKYPHIKLTLSKIRSLKREMRVVGEDCGMQPVTIAMASVYFEKLKLEERFRISRRELISFEFTILVALEMALYLPESKVMPHYRKLVQLQQSKQ
ncbi:CDK5 and ABL1 enzyme substrate 2 [Liparis tanakae]|uniref:CDK5 and ABL1 enzyme substrate 2 n=1 Tax=Liparis tanakae TaxID=230148 RepID=A0A4Z2F7N4_9TELE|nr:CDK5 and ABL1 enzyme substrate 2 [Liparis tanakae]